MCRLGRLQGRPRLLGRPRTLHPTAQPPLCLPRPQRCAPLSKTHHNDLTCEQRSCTRCHDGGRQEAHELQISSRCAHMPCCSRRANTHLRRQCGEMRVWRITFCVLTHVVLRCAHRILSELCARGHHWLPSESEPPLWLSWLERWSHNPEVASSILASGNTRRRLTFSST